MVYCIYSRTLANIISKELTYFVDRNQGQSSIVQSQPEKPNNNTEAKLDNVLNKMERMIEVILNELQKQNGFEA